MLLTGSEIRNQVSKNKIFISDFDENRLNPNSYNLRMSDELYRYEDLVLTTRRKNNIRKVNFKDVGKETKEIMLVPGILYLGKTIEETWSDTFVACIDGRSSIARLGIQIHLTAGFGDLGYKGRWTLEFSVVQPVILTEGIELCQVYFYAICGNNDILYNGRYQGGDDVYSKVYEVYKYGHKK